MRDVVEARQRDRRKRRQAANGQHREPDAARPRHSAQERALGEQLPHDAATPRAERQRAA